MTNDRSKELARSIQKQPMSVQIAERIIEEICNGAYSPGASLPSEQQLASDFRVSRPIVREAFKFLSAQGFVSISTGKSASIREVNGEMLRVFMRRVLAQGAAKDISDLFQLRIAMERMSVELAARNRTQKEIKQLAAALVEMGRYVDQPAIYSEFDIRFHVLLAQASHNIFLYHLISSIRETLVWIGSRMRQQLTVAQSREVHEHHRDIYAAVERSDPAGAAAAMDIHCETIMERLRKSLRRKPLRFPDL